jgi:hypothetical protein
MKRIGDSPEIGAEGIEIFENNKAEDVQENP